MSKQVRRFGNSVKASVIVRDLGPEGGRFSPVEWRPEEQEQDRPQRPDKAAVMNAMHEAAGLRRLLDERTKLADASDAIWHDAEDVFAEMEALLAT